MRNVSQLLVLAIMLSACGLFAPQDGGPRLENLPPQFSMYSQPADHVAEWWRDFASPELDGLIEEAIAGNFSIQEAWARLEQARLAAMKAGAAQLPELSALAGGADTEKKEEGPGRTAAVEWSLGFAASYEVDLWGRVRAAKESSALASRATAEDLKAAMMTVTGQIAENWLNLISNRQQQELYARQLDLEKQLLQVIEIRFPLARSTALDIYQQQQVIEKIEAALIPLARREEIIMRQLAFLTGKAAIAEGRLIQNNFPVLQGPPAIGLPADLLADRPDVRSAGLRLQAAEWEIAAARAERLPALKLTGSHTYSAEELSSIFDNWLLNLAANLTGPIFDGSRRRLEVERTKAVADERLASYGKTVFTAIREVEDALAEEQLYRETSSSLARQLALSEKTRREATRRYLNGNSDFLNVLREELNILQVRQDLIVAEEGMLVARVRLYKGLGGSWTDEIVD